MSDIIQSEGGMCKCGCGQRTRISDKTDRAKGFVRGQPLRFIFGHSARKAAATRWIDNVPSRTDSSHGYVIVSRKYEHDAIAERVLGRPLKTFGAGHPDNEVVHHVDGNKKNNAPANLLICTHSYHTALHARLEASPLWPEFPPRVRRPDLVRQS